MRYSVLSLARLLPGMLCILAAACGDDAGAEECRVTNCHGMDITCGRTEQLPCDLMYMVGDRCREFAECVETGGTCRFRSNPKFESCKVCVEKCIADFRSPDQMVEQLSCESACGS